MKRISLVIGLVLTLAACGDSPAGPDTELAFSGQQLVGVWEGPRTFAITEVVGSEIRGCVWFRGEIPEDRSGIFGTLTGSAIELTSYLLGAQEPVWTLSGTVESQTLIRAGGNTYQRTSTDPQSGPSACGTVFE